MPQLERAGVPPRQKDVATLRQFYSQIGESREPRLLRATLVSALAAALQGIAFHESVSVDEVWQAVERALHN